MPSLGDLERDVMRALWASNEPLTVREVQRRLPPRDLAYTTIMTVLDRLTRKSLVERERVGRAYAYTAARSEEELTASLIQEVLDKATDRTSALVHFAEGIEPAEARAIRAALRSRPRDPGTTP